MKFIKSKMNKNIIYFYLISLFTLSCTTNHDNILENENNMITNDLLKFNDFKEFNEKIEFLNQLNQDEFDKWIIENNPNSLYHVEVENEFLNNLPREYRAILNMKSEFALGDKLIWLNEEKLYEFDLNKDINHLKVDIDELKVIGEIKVQARGEEIPENLFEENTNITQGRSNIYQGVIDSRHQLEFKAYSFKDCSNQQKNINSNLKYVHELIAVQTVMYGTGISRLYLRVKLEYLKKRWRAAGEPRNMDVNINISGTYLQFNHGGNVPSFGSNFYNLSYTCSQDQQILLKTSDTYSPQFGNPFWSVQVTGTIYHELHGGYYPWHNNSNW